MKISEIKEKNKNELKKLLEDKKELVRKLRFDIASKQVKNHREYRNARKDVAKILTVLNEKSNS
ncbi:50S ribosomal protein L29 [bacterium BMS3Abin15]|nr:50S ribosomal protein L29 [bacterium BMS3Abin15]HDH07446.1 50S ribosomal protein L29 [Candidatus Moranbacteria bacterium]HDZ84977.1 50S ribosomal protein L29 [Candidatus Moranbacteria bacterium]